VPEEGAIVSGALEEWGGAVRRGTRLAPRAGAGGPLTHQHHQAETTEKLSILTSLRLSDYFPLY